MRLLIIGGIVILIIVIVGECLIIPSARLFETDNLTESSDCPQEMR